MSNKFYVRLTLRFLDGTITETIADIWEAVALDRSLQQASPPQDKAGLVEVTYTTLRELPGDDTQGA